MRSSGSCQTRHGCPCLGPPLELLLTELLLTELLLTEDDETLELLLTDELLTDDDDTDELLTDDEELTDELELTDDDETLEELETDELLDSSNVSGYFGCPMRNHRLRNTPGYFHLLRHIAHP